MGLRFGVALLSIAQLLSLAARAGEVQEPGAERVDIGVMGLKAVGLPQEQVDVISDLIAEKIGGLGDVRVVSEGDVQAMLDLEKKKRLAGCSENECFTEIAGALGMPWMVTGNLSLLGKSMVLNLKLIDVRQAHVAGRVTRRIRGDFDNLLDELPEAIEQLFARAQEDLGISLSGSVSIASRHYQPIGESPSAVWVITREDIEASGAGTIPDLLRLVPGMEVVVTCPMFAGTSIRQRWTTENRDFLVLIDGREVNNEIMGRTFYIGQPISLSDIQRIEVIRGPGSALYGANAYIGVVSITTRSVPEEPSAWVQLGAGEPGMTEAAARASTRMGPWGLSLNAGGAVSGAFYDPARYGMEAWNLRSTLDYRLSPSRSLLVDGGFAHVDGPLATNMGMGVFDVNFFTLHLAYRGEELRGQIYWSTTLMEGGIDAPLEVSGVRLAEFIQAGLTGHTVDGEIQWTAPRWWESLLVILGGGGRLSYAGSPDMLDADTYANPASPDYHQMGIDHWEWRAGAFAHAELSPADWVTATFGLRFDYNTSTGEFVSPRLAAVFRPAAGQFVRLGVARSFRKPSFFETDIHPGVRFPEGSPITGAGQQEFLEFVTRVVGNGDLLSESLVSFEAGYLGRFLESRLTLNLDLYCNVTFDRVTFEQNISVTDQGLPDLDVSSFMYQNQDEKQYTFGLELSARFEVSRHLSLLAWWSHKQVFQGEHDLGARSPRNLMGLGGRFRTESGLVGSLYAFSRSEFWDPFADNPAGLLEPRLRHHIENQVLLLSKLGWRLPVAGDLEVEAGIKLFFPVNFAAPHFSIYERGGGVDYLGRAYGGQELSRVVTAYLQGSY